MNILLAAFPKGFMDELVVTRSLSLFDWIELAGELEIDGLEFYDGFLESREGPYLERVRKALETRKFWRPSSTGSPACTRATAISSPATRRRSWLNPPLPRITRISSPTV